MLVLWAGLPILALSLHLLSPKTNPQMSMTLFAMFMVSSLSGTIASIMLSVGIIHEKNRGVYPLFLVRPVKRRDIVLGKFFAVFSCIAVAAVITMLVGLAYDVAKTGAVDALVLREAGKSAVIGLSLMAVASSAGILIGILSPSVLLGVILVLYGGNQLSLISSLPVFLKFPHQTLFSAAFGVVMTTVLLATAIVVFNRKQF